MFRVKVAFKALGPHLNGEFKHLLTLKAISIGGYDEDNTYIDNGRYVEHAFLFPKQAQAIAFNAWVLTKDKIRCVEYHNIVLEEDDAVTVQSIKAPTSH